MGASVLVIDDDATVRETVRQVLESASYMVTGAADGEHGLRLFRENQPDIVITDLIMPEKEGISTILDLRGIWPDGPIIAISGGGRMGNADYLAMAQRLGATAIIAKPFEPEDLLETVKRLLQGGRS